MPYAACRPVEQQPPKMQTLGNGTEAALAELFLRVPVDHRRILPQVCRAWRQVCRKNGELWSHVEVSLPADFLHTVDTVALYRWFLAHAAQVQQLEVEIGSPDCWAVVHGILGLVGRQLRHLRVYAEGEGCYEPGGRAGWLALVPGLSSLEVENAADWTIGSCRFPLGLARLELSYCGEEGLTVFPKHLGELTSLASLSLQGSQFEGRVKLCGLQGCQHLQRLNLSDCCLEEVPPCLAALAGSLTSLTLNSNPDLGGEGNAGRVAALAALTSLRKLEMRECALVSVPASVVRLTALRTLLLGLNAMSAAPFVLPGTYLAGLEMLGLSDLFDEDSGVTLEEVVENLEGASGLHVLRLNRNLGLTFTAPGLEALLRGKPRLRRLEFSEDMAVPGLDWGALRARHPGISFRAVD